jgi:hypothetical protein
LQRNAELERGLGGIGVKISFRSTISGLLPVVADGVFHEDYLG